MSQPITKDTEQYIDNKEHDDLFLAKRITDVGSDDQKPWDDTTTANVVYLGRAGRGVATSATGWVIRKIDTVNKTSQCAIDAWDNRATTASYS